MRGKEAITLDRESEWTNSTRNCLQSSTACWAGRSIHQPSSAGWRSRTLFFITTLSTLCFYLTAGTASNGLPPITGGPPPPPPPPGARVTGGPPPPPPPPPPPGREQLLRHLKKAFLFKHPVMAGHYQDGKFAMCVDRTVSMNPQVGILLLLFLNCFKIIKNGGPKIWIFSYGLQFQRRKNGSGIVLQSVQRIWRERHHWKIVSEVVPTFPEW